MALAEPAGDPSIADLFGSGSAGLGYLEPNSKPLREFMRGAIFCLPLSRFAKSFVAALASHALACHDDQCRRKFEIRARR
jgi:hypothetical protein